MRKVFKYTFNVMQDRNVIMMPKGARILSAQFQGDHLQIWALVNPYNDLEARTLLMVGTGHSIENEEHLVFIDTCQFPSLHLVYHVFEVIP